METDSIYLFRHPARDHGFCEQSFAAGAAILGLADSPQKRSRRLAKTPRTFDRRRAKVKTSLNSAALRNASFPLSRKLQSNITLRSPKLSAVRHTHTTGCSPS